jgi:hypothetical protein
MVSGCNIPAKGLRQAVVTTMARVVTFHTREKSIPDNGTHHTNREGLGSYHEGAHGVRRYIYINQV